MIPRLVQNPVLHSLNKYHKIHLLYGPRQVGKTTLLSLIESQLSSISSVSTFNCDFEEHLKSIDTTELASLSRLVRNTSYLLIDEAQRLTNPGLTLKILHDQFPLTQVIATGSAAFALKNQLSDALTGRYLDYFLYPLSLMEIITYENLNTSSISSISPIKKLTQELLLFGTYPEIYLTTNHEDKQKFLKFITQSYLFKDIFNFQKVRASEPVINLAKALAYQIGSLVNENELANRLKIDHKTVSRFIDILEQAFVIFRLYPWSKNPRREIGRSYKIYFIDLGIRNALINNFEDLHIRPDTGAMWENFLISERWKLAAHLNQTVTFNYWRTYNGAEVDLVETRSQTQIAYEFKWGKETLGISANNFTGTYHIPVNLINQDTFIPFLTQESL